MCTQIRLLTIHREPVPAVRIHIKKFVSSCTAEWGTVPKLAVPTGYIGPSVQWPHGNVPFTQSFVHTVASGNQKAPKRVAVANTRKSVPPINPNVFSETY